MHAPHIPPNPPKPLAAPNETNPSALQQRCFSRTYCWDRENFSNTHCTQHLQTLATAKRHVHVEHPHNAHQGKEEGKIVPEADCALRIKTRQNNELRLPQSRQRTPLHERQQLVTSVCVSSLPTWSPAREASAMAGKKPRLFSCLCYL